MGRFVFQRLWTKGCSSRRSSLCLYQGLTEIIQRWEPEVLVVERVFFAKNPVSALKLGQARGAILLTARMHSVRVVEYSATEVKSAVVGNGQASKDQVARMLSLMFGPQVFETSDAQTDWPWPCATSKEFEIVSQIGSPLNSVAVPKKSA
jgi:crossover junction endodeoxyribonuclease RuvC